jgi:hypothetical protein
VILHEQGANEGIGSPDLSTGSLGFKTSLIQRCFINCTVYVRRNTVVNNELERLIKESVADYVLYYGITPVILCGILVSVLAIETKVRGFKPSRERWIFKGHKNRRTPSFGEEIKPSKYERDTS